MGLNKKIAIWGSTGSIGTQTLDIVYANRDLFSVETLTSHVNINKLFEQALKVSPEFAVITGIKRDQIWIEKFKEAGATLLFGKEGLLKAASESGEELVLNALVGRAGLEPTVKAIEAGKTRTDKPRILKINGKQAIRDGIKIYHAGKDVYVTDSIDGKYIEKLERKIEK